MSSRTLVLGGSRSGKSEYAEALLPAEATYVATGRRDPSDAEWQERIAAHVARRPAGWRTVETADVAELVRAAGPGDPPLLVDDVATWLTAVLGDCGVWDGGAEALAAARGRCDELLAAVRCCPARMVLVSSEVGMSVVPESRSGRLFRDELGTLNTRLAAACDEVVLVVAGLSMPLKRGRHGG